jgi:hypothetical protein
MAKIPEDNQVKAAARIWAADPSDKVIEMLESGANVEDIIEEMEKIEQAANTSSPLDPERIIQCDICGEDVKSNEMTMHHLVSERHKEVERVHVISNMGIINIDKNADSPGLFNDTITKKGHPQRKEEMTLNQILLSGKQQVGKQQDLTNQVEEGIEEIDDGMPEIEAVLEDIDKSGATGEGLANHSISPSTEQPKVISGQETSEDTRGQETGVEKRIRKSQSKGDDGAEDVEGEVEAPAETPGKKKQEFPDGYVREDGYINCPILKKNSRGKYYRTHAWVTKEHFEDLMRLGKLPLVELPGLVKLVEEQFGKQQEGLDKQQAEFGKQQGALVKLTGPTLPLLTTKQAMEALYKKENENQRHVLMLDVLAGAKYLPGAGPLMMMLAKRVVYLNERLEEYQRIRSLLDVPLWVEYRYQQQLIATIDQINKMAGLVTRSKGMTDVTITAIVKCINEVITDKETKIRLITALQKITEASRGGTSDR